MDHLWTPWRFQYIASNKDEGCVFCRILGETDDQANFILRRSEHSFVVLNRFPYTSGHLMVVARRHIPSLVTATPAELSEIILSAQEMQQALEEVYHPDGFNIGFNLGRSAGAGIAGHLHLHVVPRWHGDSNFVSVLGETRVIPEDLAATYSKIETYLASRSSTA